MSQNREQDKGLAETALLRGLVRDPGGAAIAGARVEALLRSTGLDAAGGVEDRRVTQSDGRGRFRLELLRGYAYSVIATWKTRDGTRRQSILRESVHAPTQLRLIEAPWPLGAAALRARTTAETAKMLAGARVRVAVPGEAIRVVHEGPLALADGARTVFDTKMSNADGKLYVEALLGGFPVFARRIQVPAAPREVDIDLRSVSEYRLLVRDEKGRAIPKARVRASVCYPDPWRQIARGNDAGEVTLRLFPMRSWLTFAVDAPGYEEDLISISGAEMRRKNKVVKVGKDPILVTLRKALWQAGLVRGFDGRPIPGFRLDLSYKLRSWQLGSVTTSLTTRAITTDAQGRYRIPSLTRNPRQITIEATLPRAAWKQLLPRLAHSAAPSARVVLLHAPRLPDANTLPTIDLSKWRLRPLEIRAADGSPARGTAMLPRAKIRPDDALDLRAFPRSDRRGRISCFAHAGSGDTVLISEGIGWKLVSERELLKESEPGAALRLDLDPLHRVRLQLRDADGKAVPDMRARVQGWSAAAGIPNDRLLGAIDRSGLRGTSDADGRIDMWWIGQKGLSYRIGFRDKNGKLRASLRLETPSDELTLVTIDS